VTLISTTKVVTVILPQEAFGRCVIASAAYGSELAEPVQHLREFREQYIRSGFAGAEFLRIFERFYYSFSAAVASKVAESQPIATVVRLLLYPLLSILRASSAVYHASGSPPELETIMAGIFCSALLGVTYLAPLVFSIQYSSTRRGRPTVAR
jgi:hypothetical protein